jgi:hypothetical protein
MRGQRSRSFAGSPGSPKAFAESFALIARRGFRRKKFAQILHRFWGDIEFAQNLHKPPVAHFLHKKSYPKLPINPKYMLILQGYCGVVTGNES